MKNFLIRDIEEDLFNRIKKRAQTDSVSMNKFILSVLRVNAGLARKGKKKNHFTDLDMLVGKWNEDEYKLINKEIGKQRKIDKELWE